jgi:hypothetical protein
LKYSKNVCLIAGNRVLGSNIIPISFITFPRTMSAFDSCLYDVPLRYLGDNDQRTFCPVEINQNVNVLCRENTILDYKYFDLNNKIVWDNANSKKEIETNTEYWKCPDYFASSSTPQNDQTQCQQTQNNSNSLQCTFTAESRIFDTSLWYSSICENTQWVFNEANIPVVTKDKYATIDPTKCQKINQIQSFVPTLNGQQCLNSVAAVKQVIVWTADSLKRIIIRIVLTDVDVNQQHFSQMFELNWLNEPEELETTSTVPPPVNNNLAINEIKTMEQYDSFMTSNSIKMNRYSGYQIGNPVIGIFATNETANNQETSQDEITALKLKGESKLCGLFSDIERRNVGFGSNLTSSCIIRLTFLDLINNCDCLRRVLFNKLNDYFVPFNKLSKDGNPNETYSTNDWIDVYPLTRQIEDTDLNGELNLFGNQCINVPSKVTLWIFYKMSGKQRGETLSNIVGSQLSYSYSNFQFRCYEDDNEKCRDSLITQDFRIDYQIQFINITK